MIRGVIWTQAGLAIFAALVTLASHDGLSGRTSGREGIADRASGGLIEGLLYIALLSVPLAPLVVLILAVRRPPRPLRLMAALVATVGLSFLTIYALLPLVQ